MINPKVLEALNKQVNAEFHSAYLYLSMAAYFESQSLVGMANWMQVQAQEELGHAMKFYAYINDRDGRVILTEIVAPKTEWKSSLEAFQDAHAHEQKISGLINDLSSLAAAEKDHATHNFLEWFVAEQVEEEATADDIVQQLRMIGDDAHALFMIDRELGQRVFTPPEAEA